MHTVDSTIKRLPYKILCWNYHQNTRDRKFGDSTKL